MNLNAKKSGAYARLRQLADQMRAVGREGVDEAVAACERYLQKRGASELARSKKTGNAVSTHKVDGSRKGWVVTEAAYAIAGNFKPGSKSAPKGKPAGHIRWSFFNGTPITALNHMRKLFGLEAIKRLGG